ncbi:MAG TPA: hypothetical protein VF800_28650 [Telluria sp.]|jgi:hypothetical protein
MAANSGTQANIEPPIKLALICGECDTYTELQKKKAKEPGFERDHIPSKAALRDAAIQRYLPKILNKDQIKCVARKVEARGITVAIPRPCHRHFSPTCGANNTKKQLELDAASPESLAAAVDRDLAAMPQHLDFACREAYAQAAMRIKEHDNEDMIDKATKECTKK